jgi:hypothetical protein
MVLHRQRYIYISPVLRYSTHIHSYFPPTMIMARMSDIVDHLTQNCFFLHVIQTAFS